jgi:hypothetical protein
MTALANSLIGITCGLLWMGFAGPAILRALGLPVAFGMWRMDRRNQHLDRTQYVWTCGVFRCGLGMFLYFTISRYLDWRLLGDKFSYLSPRVIFVGLFICLGAGWVSGLFGAPHRTGADSTSR